MTTTFAGQVLLGTVALEPNRWGTVHPDRRPTIDLERWLPSLAALPIDGLEMWDRHLTSLPARQAAIVAAGPPPTVVFNSYVGFDDGDDAERTTAAEHVHRSGARAVKFNVGNDPAAEADYAERLARWLDALPDHVAALCECHQGISIAEDPAVAARILAAAGPASRAQALVHTHDPPELLAEKFDALGERITHVHVNHLDFECFRHPPLAEVADRLAAAVTTIRKHGFRGSWTLEFVAGLLTDDDHPEALLAQAADDLVVLRRVLEDT